MTHPAFPFMRQQKDEDPLSLPSLLLMGDSSGAFASAIKKWKARQGLQQLLMFPSDRSANALPSFGLAAGMQARLGVDSLKMIPR